MLWQVVYLDDMLRVVRVLGLEPQDGGDNMYTIFTRAEADAAATSSVRGPAAGTAKAMGG
jgi:hypothetical protein